MPRIACTPQRRHPAGMRVCLILSWLVFAAVPAFAAPDRSVGLRIAQQCKSCHSIGRRGASPNPESPPFRTLGRKYAVDNLAESLAEGIIVGHAENMPRVKMTPAQISDFLTYLKSIQAK